MSDVNKVFVLGNLGRDPELKYTEAGKALCRLAIATTRRWSNRESGETIEETEWHRVTVWGPSAEMCDKFLSKGDKVHIEGRLRTHSWEDKESKKKMYSTEIVAENVNFVNTKNRGGDSGSSQNQGGQPPQQQYSQPPQSAPQGSDIDDDDIPF